MRQKTVIFLKYFIIGLIISLIICDFNALYLIDKYTQSHASANINRTVMVISDYLLSLAAYSVLFSLLKLIESVLKNNVFTSKVVKYIGIVEISCAFAAIISFVSGFSYNVYFIIAISALLITLIAETLRIVFINAAKMKEEMDLVI